MTPQSPYDRRHSDKRNDVVEIFMDETKAQLAGISGQISDIKREMVTRNEYNEAHRPLVMMVKEHDAVLKEHIGIIQVARKWGWRMLVAILLAALFSPHSAYVFAAIKKIFE